MAESPSERRSSPEASAGLELLSLENQKPQNPLVSINDSTYGVPCQQQEVTLSDCCKVATEESLSC